jgi:ABC-type branched-subunit amino acid transport system substrate-binding protein
MFGKAHVRDSFSPLLQSENSMFRRAPLVKRALLSSCIFALFCSSALAQQKVGVLAGFTGDWGSYGVAYRHGIELADVGPKATFVYEDDGFLPAKSVSAFRKLLEVDKISSALVGDTVTAQAVAPIALRQKIPLLVWASGAKFANNPFVLRLWTADEKDLSFIGDEIKRRGYKRLALFTSTHTYSAAWARALMKQYPGSIWEDFSTNPDGFQSSIMKAKAGGFDAIGVCLGGGLNGRFAKQLRNLGLDTPLFGCNFIEASADIEAADGAFDGVWFTAPKLSPEFMTAYKTRFGFTDHVISAAVFHDAALLVTDTKEKPFAISGLREEKDDGGRRLEFEFQVLRFRGSQIVVDPG